MPEKKKIKNRRLIIAYLIIIALLSLSVIIIYQYNKYTQVEQRLDKAYASTNFQSSTLYNLFSTFSEADYLFRLYSINFNNDDYHKYILKLDTIHTVIDSLATLPPSYPYIDQSCLYDIPLAAKYTSLKKQIDHLVLYAKDTMFYIVDLNVKHPIQSPIDTLPHSDPLSNIEGIHNTKQMNLVLRENIEALITCDEKQYNNKLSKLKSTFNRLQAKERDLLFANFNLLNNLKNGIIQLRQLEYEKYKHNQEADFLIYKQKTKTIKDQLFIGLSLMVLMIILIIGYQRQVYSYERKIIKEKEYADTIAEEKTNVLANISHEIRSPLNSLKGLVNLIKDQNTGVDNEIIHSIDHDISIINSSINDILSLSKLEAESLEIKNEYINIANLITDLVGLHAYQAKIKGIELKINNLLSPRILIYSNPFRIKQIVSNLIANAIKYTNEGQVLVTSEIINNSQLVITIEDTGIGIHKDQWDHVFRKYYIANNKSKGGSFGLGLYISKLLSEQIQGKISFTSIVNKGTIFRFEVPISEIKEGDLSSSSNYSITDIPQELSIVFIDDSKINLFFMKQIFKEKSNISFFMDPNKAIDYINHHNVDIVITDIKMPNLSGWEVLNIIKSNPDKKSTKVFASTAELLLLESSKSKYQFDGTINKPVKENELVAEILKHINYSSIG